MRANHFANADVFGEMHRARRRQVHVIDAGDEHDENGDSRENINVSDFAFALVAVDLNVRRMKMNLAQRLHVQRARHAKLLRLVSIDERCQLGLRNRGVIFFEQHVGNESLGIPHIHVALPAVDRLQSRKGIQHAEIQMRIARHLAQHAGDFEISELLDDQRFAVGIFLAKKFSCGFDREHDGLGIAQGGLGVALRQRKIEQFKKAGLGEKMIAFVKTRLAILHRAASGAETAHQPHRVGNFRQLLHHRRTYRSGSLRDMLLALIRRLLDLDDAIEAIRLFMKRVEIQLVENVQQNQNAASEPNRQADDVDERIFLVLAQIAQGDFEMVFEHDSPKSFCPMSEVEQLFCIAMHESTRQEIQAAFISPARSKTKDRVIHSFLRFAPSLCPKPFALSAPPSQPSHPANE